MIEEEVVLEGKKRIDRKENLQRFSVAEKMHLEGEKQRDWKKRNILKEPKIRSNCSE